MHSDTPDPVRFTSMNLVSRILMPLTAIFIVGHFWAWYPLLPGEVPSKFSISGEPTRFMNKASFVGYMAFVHVMNLCLTGLLSFTMGSIPDSLINLPNKNYWLAEPRRTASLEFTGACMRWIAIATAGLLLVMSQMSFEMAVNRREKTSPDFEIAFAVYMILTIGIVIWMFIRFSKPLEI